MSVSMRPDKKKRNRGRIVDKPEDSHGQGKGVDTKVAPEKSEVTGKDGGKSAEKPEALDKEKLTAVTTSANGDSNTNLPPLNLRRETDALKETKKPSKRQIFSDWKEYDQPILPEEVEGDQLGDFSLLIQQNIREDNYFKFKHEKQWENDTCAINKDLFNLNLQALSAGLQCIPFYERLNISTDLFSENEVKRMDNYAKQQEKVYEEILDSQDSSPIYSTLLEKLSEKSDVQLREKFDDDVTQVDSSETSFFLGHSGLEQSENELIKSLEGEKQVRVNQSPMIPLEESKVEEVELKCQGSGKPVCEDTVGKDKVIEIDSKSSQEESRKLAETKVISIASPLNELEVNNRSVEEISESTQKPLGDIPIDPVLTETSPMDMTTVFETAPLGQRVKSRRSKDKKAKSELQVESPAEEDSILDSLLSLKEPSILANNSKEEVLKEEVENEASELTDVLQSIVIHDKKENLEDWLDSMLDD